MSGPQCMVISCQAGRVAGLGVACVGKCAVFLGVALSFGVHVTPAAADWAGGGSPLAWAQSADPAAAPESPSPEADITSGREALDEAGSFNWYDSENDKIRRLELSPPPDLSSSGWNQVLDGLVRPIFEAIAWLFQVGLPQFFVLAILAILIAWMIRTVVVRIQQSRRVRGSESGPKRTPRTTAERIEALPFEVAKEVTDFLAAAKNAYEMGDYRLAIIYLFSHQLVELDKNMWIRLVKGKTNGQYLAELRAKRPLQVLMHGTVSLFESAFFGNHRIAKEQFDTCWTKLDEFTRLAARVSS